MYRKEICKHISLSVCERTKFKSNMRGIVVIYCTIVHIGGRYLEENYKVKDVLLLNKNQFEFLEEFTVYLSNL